MRIKRNIWIKMLIIVAVIELFVFNYDGFRSYTNDGYTPVYMVGSGLSLQEDGRYLVTDAAYATLHIPEINDKIDYVQLDIRVYDAGRNVQPAAMNLYMADEGHCALYYQGTITSYGDIEKLTYHRLHPYGQVYELRGDLSVTNGQFVEIEAVELNTKVPFQILPGRVMVIGMAVIFVYAFRPASVLHQWKLNGKDTKQRYIVLGVLFLNIMIVLKLVTVNPAFCGNPQWDHHYQYHRLAESLLKGQTYLDYTDTEGLASLENPYDIQLRRDNGVSEHWDTAFFDGKYYVYFGIVPVLLFYLPWLLLTNTAFPTWLGIAVSMMGIITGAFYLVYQLLKKWFAKVDFGHYLLFALFLANGSGVVTLSMRPDFYTLPIVLALACSLWGIALWLKASQMWGQKGVWRYLGGGALCLALTAGCRPQFLMGSFLFFPVLGEYFWKKKWNREDVKRICSIAIPYGMVAIGLMMYNYVRFGSPFDFGANYNITTNDMTNRGFYLGRIGEGVFQYLMQLPVLTTNFPFVRETYLTTDYLGQTIRENFFGGILISHFVLCGNFAYGSVHRSIKEKPLKLFWLMCVGAAAVILVADTAMAGILVRYMTDFVWLLFFGTVVVLSQLIEESRMSTGVTWLFIAGFIFMVMFDLLSGMQLTELRSFLPEKYYEIQAFF